MGLPTHQNQRMNFLTTALAFLVFTLAVACSSSGEQTTTEAPPESEAEPAAPETPPAETTAMMEQGQTVYNQYCLACHQGDGKGVPGAFPPLNQTKWTEGDESQLITVILNGMQGPIEVKGESYNNVMPQHAFLSDEDIAAVLTYVRQSFGNDASEITTDKVAEVRASGESG